MRDDAYGEPLALKAYSSFADRYSELAPTKAHNGSYERPASLSLLGDVSGLRVLDAGCGPGIAGEIMARAGGIVTGFDVVPEMIALARKRCDGLGVDLRVANLERPFDWIDDESLDRILCSLALDYVEELTPVFREFRRVTKPGGKLVFSMSHPMSDWNHEATRGDEPYYQRWLHGLYWSSFGEPKPFVEAYRRPLEETFNALIDGGWTVDRVLEPQPLPEMKRVDARTYGQLSQSPHFICIRTHC